ncbi:amidohydrolase [Caballeronia temeraria]|uniref:Amidohydrolase n=1 Tax=Caballeronia temeraria TaxID=1777137 RepID=A0A158DJY1_9BURK|nr:amidohydrolase family protein [Caballeronia temeraria]SAK94710.1 amidohydrolase [Caballeronia temeraria]
MNANQQQQFIGNRVRETLLLDAWHSSATREEIVDPGMPIVDAHHHLYGESSDPHFYQLTDLTRDLTSGHKVIATVYVEAYFSGWRETGPESMRPVGEVEKIVGLTRSPIETKSGKCQAAAGIVSHADLTLGADVVQVLEAQLAVGDGRLRGVRHMSVYAEGALGKTIHKMPKKYLLADKRFREGIAQLERFDLSFDAWGYYYQIGELAALADAFPNVTMVVDHIGGVIGVEEFREKSETIRSQWAKDMRDLARRPNVNVKIGGLGMPMLGFGFEDGAKPASSADALVAWRPYIETCVDTFGPDRCLFESNFPVDRQSCGYVQLWNAFKLATRSMSEEERRALFYRTACRVYRLPEIRKLGDACAST